MKVLNIPYIEQIPSKNFGDLSGFISENGASSMIESVNWPKEFPYKPLTEFNIIRNSSGLIIRFFVRGNLLKAVYSEDQSPVYKDSCVELFCKLPESEYYYNFEFNCIGTCSASRRKSRNEDVQRLSSEQLLQIKRYSSIGRKAFKELQGMFEWELIVEIPFSVIDIDPQNMPDKILANFYKCAEDTESPHYVSWNPIPTDKPDFHRPEYFGTLIL